MVKATPARHYLHTVRCIACKENVPTDKPRNGKEWVRLHCALCGSEGRYAAVEVRPSLLSRKLGPKLVGTQEWA